MTSLFFKRDLYTAYTTRYAIKLHLYDILYKIQYNGIHSNPEFRSWNEILRCSAEHNDSERVAEMAIAHGADCWNEALANACRVGDLPLVRRMIDHGADDWEYGFAQACLGGQRALVDLMISKARNKPFGACALLDWNRGLSMVAASGNIELVKDLIRLGADDYNAALVSAAYVGDSRVAQLMIGLGADDFEGAMENATFGGQHAMVYYMVKLGARNWQCGLRTACLDDNQVLVDYFIRCGALASACENCHGWRHKK